MLYPYRLILGMALPCLLLLPNSALANRKACQNLEQRYAQCAELRGSNYTKHPLDLLRSLRTWWVASWTENADWHPGNALYVRQHDGQSWALASLDHEYCLGPDQFQPGYGLQEVARDMQGLVEEVDVETTHNWADQFARAAENFVGALPEPRALQFSHTSIPTIDRLLGWVHEQ